MAMLLMALAPAVSRWLASDAGGSSGWSALCTMAGLKWVKVPPSADDPAPASPSLAGGMDCAYCVLLASLPLALLALSLWFPWLAARRGPLPWRVPRLRIVVNRRGIGSRGPPLAL